MGGLNSGRWGGYCARQQADASFILCAPLGRLLPAILASRRLVWKWPAFGRHALGDVYGDIGQGLRVRLTGLGHGQTICIEATTPNYGGLRLWWTCPDCQRRSGKLYMPPRASRFACRLCHDLSYESAQMSRGLWPAVWQADARNLGCSTRFFRETFRAFNGAYWATAEAHTAKLGIIPPDDDALDGAARACAGEAAAG